MEMSELDHDSLCAACGHLFKQHEHYLTAMAILPAGRCGQCTCKKFQMTVGLNAIDVSPAKPAYAEAMDRKLETLRENLRKTYGVRQWR
jgi:predicted  nucleic acid-binding Zn-ribbon protein